MAEKITKKLAEEIAAKLKSYRDWDSLRDHVDFVTHGELDTWKLDRLTDWVMTEKGWWMK